MTDPESGERQLCDDGAAGREVEPLYGRTYLPRKFKIAMAPPYDNCVDVYTPDLGLLAVIEGGHIIGYNFLVGGGFGMTPSNKKTFPALGKRMAFVPTEEVFAVAEAVIQVQRDHGNRSDRSSARMKYLVAAWGLEKFKATVEEYYGCGLAAPHPTDVQDVDDHLGWHEQGDGRWFYGLNVENGRILDRDGLKLKPALREVCRTFSPGVHLTPQQSILLTDLPADARRAMDRQPYPPDEGFLESIRMGLPPCGGMAVGVDRLIMAILGLDHINLVQAFPTERL
mgnify:CR=1 FL=1